MSKGDSTRGRVGGATRTCYYCGRRRLRHLLERLTLAGPAARKVYACREVCHK